MSTYRSLLGAAAALCMAAVAACSSTSTPPPTMPTPTAAPDTAAGALSAAKEFFLLYGAEHYQAVYPMVAPPDRAQIAESLWVGVHQACLPPTKLVIYRVASPVLTGTTAVVTVTQAGATGSEQATFQYSDHRWYFEPPDMQIYAGHSLDQAVAAAKARNVC